MMKIESTKPVHWYITCQMEPSDVRAAMKMVLKPSVILRVLKMALGIGGAPAVAEAEVVTAAAGRQVGGGQGLGRHAAWATSSDTVESSTRERGVSHG